MLCLVDYEWELLMRVSNTMRHLHKVLVVAYRADETPIELEGGPKASFEVSWPSLAVFLYFGLFNMADSLRGKFWFLAPRVFLLIYRI